MGVWFPEPVEADNTFAMPREGEFRWLGRSTTERAIACRRFLNENISKLPIDWQPKLYKDLRDKDWFDTFFELVVGRSLQIVGASIEVEVPIEGTNKNPDFLAQFPDGTVIVEATVPKTNESIREHSDRNKELVKIIEALAPEGWWVAVWRLPKLGPSDSKQHFKRAVKEIFNSLRLEDSGQMVEVSTDIAGGEISMSLIPGRKGGQAVGIHGVAYGMNDTEIKIRKTLERKKKQVRKASDPVLLAIGTQPLSGGLDDFDRALFGRTYERLGYFREPVEVGFDGDGLFAKKRPEAPTYAGVLAFTGVGWRGVPDPVLYLHPRFNGNLPQALGMFEQRTYTERLGVNIRPAQGRSILQEMNFVPDDI
jgi:hypothetical protein